MTTLAELRAKLLEQDKAGSRELDNAVYPFWNIPNDATATLRFLPDNDPDNTFFWVERQMIKLQFPGIKGNDGSTEAKNVTVNVPCIEMWGETCPVHAEIRPWFNNSSLEDVARKYWKKRSYIFQGFVVNNTLENDVIPENPIRRFVINPSIFKIIKAALMDIEMENLPTDLSNGTDFRLTKTQKGQYADYTTSSWARKERALSAEELSALEKYGLFNLNDYLPNKPSKDGVEAIYAMFKASVDGEYYDQNKWGEFYRPFGLDNNATNESVSSNPTASENTSNVEDKTVTEEVSSTPDSDSKSESNQSMSAEEILAKIRNRNSTNN